MTLALGGVALVVFVVEAVFDDVTDNSICGSGTESSVFFRGFEVVELDCKTKSFSISDFSSLEREGCVFLPSLFVVEGNPSTPSKSCSINNESFEELIMVGRSLVPNRKLIWKQCLASKDSTL